jgi:nitronate monooxygenase
VLDIVVDSPWPHRFTARTLRNRFTDVWHGHEDALRFDSSAKAEYRDGVERGDPDYLPVWAGEAVDLVNDVDGATTLVGRIAADAARMIDAVHANLDG